LNLSHTLKISVNRQSQLICLSCISETILNPFLSLYLLKYCEIIRVRPDTDCSTYPNTPQNHFNLFLLKNFMRVKRKSRVGLEERSVFARDKLLKTTVLPTCKSCGTSKMSSIPMGAHAAFKVRNTLNANGDRFDKQQQPSFTNTDAAPPQPTPPARYNSKLMNSVWGMYNRYSVHNIKSHISYDKAWILRSFRFYMRYCRLF